MSNKKPIKSKQEVLESVVESLDDIFVQAAEQSINIRTLTIKEENITGANITLPTTYVTRKNWKELKIAIDTEHAERFNRILHELPDREFARVYLKSLEFFKPKVIRQAGGEIKQTDQTINIQINYGNKEENTI